MTDDSEQSKPGSLTGGISRFEVLLLRTTIARAGLDLLSNLQGASAPALADPNREHRDRILFVFDQMERAASLPSPKFVFVHILSPRPPMVFGPDVSYFSARETVLDFGPVENTWRPGE